MLLFGINSHKNAIFAFTKLFIAIVVRFSFPLFIRYKCYLLTHIALCDANGHIINSINVSHQPIAGMLSILIPTYNYDCTQMVKDLCAQFDTIDDEVEVIVGDDCSSRVDVINALSAINDLPHCRCIRLQKNVGRSVIRNYLAQQARGEWVLYMDSDGGIVSKDFLRNYWNVRDKAMVIEGSIIHPDHCPSPQVSLRYYYEKSAEPMFTAAERNKAPYACFRTFNFMARRDVMLRVPFNERFYRYGYEDILFGINLQNQGVSVLHIDNPLMNLDIETNTVFLNKVKEANTTLIEFYDELRLNSRIVRSYESLVRWHVEPMVRTLFQWVQPLIVKQLLSIKPSVFLFNCYKLGNFCCLMKQKS